MSTFLGTLQSGKRPGRRRSHGDANLTPGASKFTVETAGVTAVAEVQTVDTDGTGGTFTLSSPTDETGTIAFDATVGTVETAIETLDEVTSATVTGSTGGPWVITFNDGLEGIVLLVADDALLTGETVGTTVELTTPGVANVFEVVSFWVDGDSGTFTLSYGGQTTATIVYSANAALIDTRLTALSSIADVAVTGAGTKVSRFIVTFADPAGVATAITADTTLLKMAVVDADRVS